jgi:NADH-quinone oxidoreductase subunit N
MNVAPLVNPYGFSDWSAVLPLFVVGVAALVVLLADLVSRRYPHRFVSIGIGIAGLVAAGVYAGTSYGQNYDAFDGGFVLGGFTVVFEEIIIVSAIFSLVLYSALGRSDRIAGSVALMLWSTSGAMLMAGAANLMTIFLGLELLSLALYCLCGLADRRSSKESALKYLILSSTASGFLLFGMALLFGASGSVTLASLAAPAVGTDPLYWIGGGLFLVGIAFKLSLVPFHVWSPDVYEGAPLPVTAFMSVVTKAGTLAVFARFAYGALPPGTAHAMLMPFFIVAGISMIAGNLGMLAQTEMKRLLAYSGIAQAGYIVAALAGASALGVRYAIYYLAAYMFMNLGAFAVIAVCSSEGEERSEIASLRGLGHRSPALAAAMTFFLLALAGFPPTAGFLGKILILSTSVTTGYAWLAGLLIAGTAISLYAYFKIIRVMYDRHAHPHAGSTAAAPLAYLSVAICAAFILIMTFYPLTPSNVLPLVR